MGCGSCFRQIARNMERQRKARKERRDIFKKGHKKQTSCQKLSYVKFTAEEKEKLKAKIYGNV